jgi:hypothetical protein
VRQGTPPRPALSGLNSGPNFGCSAGVHRRSTKAGGPPHLAPPPADTLRCCRFLAGAPLLSPGRTRVSTAGDDGLGGVPESGRPPVHVPVPVPEIGAGTFPCWQGSAAWRGGMILRQWTRGSGRSFRARARARVRAASRSLNSGTPLRFPILGARPLAAPAPPPGPSRARSRPLEGFSGRGRAPLNSWPG